MRVLRKRIRLPEVLTASLGSDERVLDVATTVDERLLAVTRWGLWIVAGDRVERIAWHLVSRARLSEGVVGLTVASEVGRWPDGTVLLRDEPELSFTPVRLTKLTDAIHDRVRRSVVASDYLPWPGAGGWVVLRQVPGVDGLTVQLRLDDGADADADGLMAATRQVSDALWPAAVPREPVTNE